jgi:hypothetical protein
MAKACENEKTLKRDRTRGSFKIDLSAHANRIQASARNLEHHSRRASSC